MPHRKPFMNDINKLLGDEATFEYDGKTWTLVPWDRFGIQKSYITFLKRRAWDAIDRSCSGLDDEHYALATSALTKDIAAGDYDWKGNVWARSLSRLVGVEQILWLTLKVKHKDIDLGTVQTMLNVKGEEIGELLKQLTSDPNLQAPAVAISA